MSYFRLGLDKNLIEDVEFEISRKRVLLRVLMGFSNPIFYYYVVHSLLSHYYLEVGLNLLCALSITIGFILTFFKFDEGRTLLLFRIIAFAFFVSLLVLHTRVFGITGQMDYIGWAVVYPVLTFLVLGEKDGFIAADGVLSTGCGVLCWSF